MARRGENIYKRKDGRYEGRYVKRYDENGKIVYGYVYARSYSETKERLLKCKLEKKPQNTGSNMLLSEWLHIWIEAETNLKETTKELYARHIRNHIIPQIGNIPLKKLNKDILQLFVNNLTFAPSTTKLIFYILKSALSCAEEEGCISNNICSKIRLPKKETSEVSILTINEQRRLENSLTERNDIGILICLYMGLRIGELCALKWSDIDFTNNVMHINGTQSRINGKLTVTSPKSKTSMRIIPIPEVLTDKLKSCKNRDEFVLSHNGGMIDVRVYRRRFKKLLESAEIPYTKFHALRHTFASRALEVGMDYKTLSEILGHASVAITMDLYVHSLDEHKKAEINKLNFLYD